MSPDNYWPAEVPLHHIVCVEVDGIDVPVVGFQARVATAIIKSWAASGRALEASYRAERGRRYAQGAPS